MPKGIGKLNLKKYKLIVNILKVEMQKMECQDEATTLDLATYYLIKHGDLKGLLIITWESLIL